MTSHRQIMVNAATAVRDSSAVLQYAVQHFGRGLEIVVGAYAGAEDASGIPGEHESPFLWLYAAGENESVAADETFTVHAVVGGCVMDANGSQIVTAAVSPRTEEANGLVVNGGNKTVEDFRDLIMGVIRDAKAGAIVQKMRRTENDISHFPLEWAEFEVDYLEPEAL